MLYKGALFLITCLALLGIPVTFATAMTPVSQSNDTAFPTPEAAITHFFEGVIENDFAKILEACAVNEIGENFRFDLHVERLRAFAPFQSYAPADYPLFVALNQADATARIANQVKFFAYSVLSDGDIALEQTTLMELEGAQDFMAAVDPSRLAGLEVIGIDSPNPDIINSDRYHENALQSAATFGADDSTERVALFSLEGSTYVLGFTLLRYGENWKINNLNSPVAGTSALGTAESITAEDFASMTQSSP